MLKRQLSLDDDTYRTVLDAIAGKQSCVDLNDEDLNLAMLALERMAAGGRDATSTVQKNARQHRFIARLMDFLGWDWKTTAQFCRHQTGKSSTRQCSAGELSKVIMGMIRIIDDRIEKKLIFLTPAELSDYQRYTKLHRTQNLKLETRNLKPETLTLPPEAPCQVGSSS